MFRTIDLSGHTHTLKCHTREVSLCTAVHVMYLAHVPRNMRRW